MQVTEQQRAKLIPLRRWVPEAFDDSQPLTLKPGRYGVDPAPVSEHDGEPLTRAEAFKFWVPVWVAVTVLGVLVGFAIGFAKAWIQS